MRMGISFAPASFVLNTVPHHFFWSGTRFSDHQYARYDH